MQPKLISVVPKDNYTLLLAYETGEQKLFDVKPYIRGSWFGELRDIDYFRAVRMYANGSGIEWGHGQDIAPDDLYEQSVGVGE